MTDGDQNREFVKAARAVHGGRWKVPLAQACGVQVREIDEALEAGPVPPAVAAVLARMIDDQVDRLARRRRDLSSAYAARGFRL